MALNDVYKVANIFTAPGSDGVMLFTAHFRTTEVNSVISDAEEAFEVAQEAVETIETLYLPLLSTEMTFEEATCVGVSNPLVGVSVSSGLPGQLGDEMVALRSAPVVKLNTGLRGRSYNGRMFLMPVTELNQSRGVITPAHVTALLGFITGYRRFSQQASGNVYDLTIFSQTLTGLGPVVDNLVTVWTVNNTMGSIRGRQKVV